MPQPPDPARGERSLAALLAGMSPQLDPVPWAFCPAPEGRPPGLPVLMEFHEAEGPTLVVESAAAHWAGLAVRWEARRITLTVHSDLDAVGFLSAVSSALSGAAISCNAVAALYHDHLFIAPADAERALQLLLAMQQRAALRTPPVIYSVRVTLALADEAEWTEWMQQDHLPAVMATGCFLRYQMGRETDPAPPAGMVSYVMDYVAASREAYDIYQSRDAPALQQAGRFRFGDRLAATRSVRTLTPSLP